MNNKYLIHSYTSDDELVIILENLKKELKEIKKELNKNQIFFYSSSALFLFSCTQIVKNILYKNYYYEYLFSALSIITYIISYYQDKKIDEIKTNYNIMNNQLNKINDYVLKKINKNNF